MNVLATENEVLQRMLPELEAQGYEVFLHPKYPIVPGFLGNFTPDALARRSDSNIVIEVLRESPSSSDKIDKLRQLLKDQEGWELRIVWISPTTSISAPEIQPLESIHSRLAEMRGLIRGNHLAAALLIGWATFEALGRLLSWESLKFPQTSGRLVETLAAEGYLTPDEAEEVRVLAKKRNELVHGGLQTELTERELSRFTDLLTTVAGLAEK